MKNKILALGIFAMSLALVGAVYATNIGGSETGSGERGDVQQQTQTANEGEDNQIQVQTVKVEQEQESEDSTETNTGTQAKQIRTQETSNTVEQEREQEQERTQSQEHASSTVGEQRRSEVANAVQEMLQVADRNGGIGEQVREIAREQNENQEKLEASLEKVKSRGSVAKFFIGADYNEINNAKKILEQNREKIKKLNEVKNKLTKKSDQTKLTEQIQTLEQTAQEVENSLGDEQKGFSLLGWMFRMLAK